MERGRRRASALRIFSGGMGLLLLIAAPASAGDKKAYHGSFCKERDVPKVKTTTNQEGIRADADNAHVFCPILRDDVDPSIPLRNLPLIRVEGWTASGGGNSAWCKVYWMKQDSDAGEIRGTSDQRSITSSGYFQATWDSLADYSGSNQGTASLASEEDSIHLQCKLDDGDRIFQYYVDEDRY